MVVAGMVVDLIFSAAKLIPREHGPSRVVEHTMIVWNYTSGLGFVALIVGASLFFLHLRAGREH